MKLETIVTAIIFLCVGFLAGYYLSITKAGGGSRSGGRFCSRQCAPAGGAGMGSAPGGNINPATGLPNGHPPMEVSELSRTT